MKKIVREISKALIIVLPALIELTVQIITDKRSD